MFFLDNNIFYDAKMNLALEEIFFSDSNFKLPILILWQNNNSVIIGKNQYTKNEIDLNFITTQNVEVVRRITGGGAVYHDLGNLNFSFIFNKNCNTINQFQNIILKSINFLGFNAKNSGRNDILINGFKVSGASFNLKKDRVLFHGTILINSNINKLSNALKPPKEKLKKNGITSVKSRVKNLSNLSRKPINLNIIKESILNNLKKEFNVTKICLTKELISKSLDLKQLKYSKKFWNYNSESINLISTKQFSNGTISITFSIKNNRIKNLIIYGDFFSIKDIQNLQNYLNGVKLINLKETINRINLDEYVFGITKEEFIRLFEV